MQVLNLVKEVEVEPDSTNDSAFHLKATGTFRTRKAAQGLGVLYFYWAGGVWTQPRFSKSLFMPHPKPLGTPISSRTGEQPITIDIPDAFPCAGAVSPELGGFLTAPTVKLDVAEGRDIAAMIIVPRGDLAKVSVGKNSLSIPGDGSQAKVELNANAQLECRGNISSSEDSAKLLLTRNSNPPISDIGLVEELAEVKEKGTINASWKPVTRRFEKLLFVFRPLDVTLADLDRLIEHVGADAQSFDETGKKPFIIADGKAASYTLKLVLKKHERGDSTDQTQIVVT